MAHEHWNSTPLSNTIRPVIPQWSWFSSPSVNATWNWGLVRTGHCKLLSALINFSFCVWSANTFNFFNEPMVHILLLMGPQFITGYLTFPSPSSLLNQWTEIAAGLDVHLVLMNTTSKHFELWNTCGPRRIPYSSPGIICTTISCVYAGKTHLYTTAYPDYRLSNPHRHLLRLRMQ